MRRRTKKKTGCLAYILPLIMILCLGGATTVVLLFHANDVVKQVKERFVEKEIPYQKVEGNQEEAGQKYYYGQLPEEEQTVYLEILCGIRENQEEIYVHASEAKRTNELFQYVLKDFPDIFWCDGRTTATAYGGEEPYTVLKPVYLYDTEVKKQKQEEIDAAVAECLGGIAADASDYEKILYVYEYIVNTVDYDMEAQDSQNIYSVFVNKRSVCAGYSKATQYLLEKLHVFCTYVTGTAGDGQAHAWNLVQCGGEYYYVDTTWGDPVFQEQGGEGQQDLNYISYDYMCCNDEELLRTHTPDEDVVFPECTKMDYNYYVMNGMYYDSYDSETALKVMNDVISEKENPVVLKYANSDVYLQARQGIFEDVLHRAAQNLAEWYGMSEVKYSYIDDEELNKIVIYWEYGD